MDVNSLNQLSNNTSGKTKDAAKDIAKTFDNFLTLLTTQLKNQDPLSPMDSTEFTNQLVQFSQVEQQINSNAKLDEMVAQGKANEIMGAAAYIDKTVEAVSDEVYFDGTNTARFGVALDSKVASGEVQIFDATGILVKTIPLSAKEGYSEITWDGKSTSGTTQEKGVYSVRVNALDADGKAVEYATSTIGLVTDIVIQDSGPKLSLNGILVTTKDLLSLKKTTTT